jgi:hypothetical protein
VNPVSRELSFQLRVIEFGEVASPVRLVGGAMRGDRVTTVVMFDAEDLADWL